MGNELNNTTNTPSNFFIKRLPNEEKDKEINEELDRIFGKELEIDRGNDDNKGQNIPIKNLITRIQLLFDNADINKQNSKYIKLAVEQKLSTENFNPLDVSMIKAGLGFSNEDMIYYNTERVNGHKIRKVLISKEDIAKSEPIIPPAEINNLISNNKTKLNDDDDHKTRT